MSNFTAEILKACQDDLGRLNLKRTVLTDDKVPGLRAIITRDAITLHVRHGLEDEKTYLKLGTLDEISIERARILTKKIVALAKTGVDPVEDMRRRFLAAVEAA